MPPGFPRCIGSIGSSMTTIVSTANDNDVNCNDSNDDDGSGSGVGCCGGYISCGNGVRRG